MALRFLLLALSGWTSVLSTTYMRRELFNTASVHPPAAFLQQILSADVAEELPDDTTLAKAVSYEWEKLLQSGNMAPFLICTENGRAGVVETMQHFNSTDYGPIYSRDGLTCFNVRSQATAVKTAIQTSRYAKYAAALPAGTKLQKGFFQSVVTGEYMTSQKCKTGIRVVFSPGFAQQKLEEISGTFLSDLASGSYKTKISENFFWAADYASLPTDVEFRRALADVVDMPARGKTWMEQLNPVLQGLSVCDFSTLEFTVQDPYLIVDNVCTLAHDSCVLALLAYVISDNSVNYVEPMPSISFGNDDN